MKKNNKVMTPFYINDVECLKKRNKKVMIPFYIDNVEHQIIGANKEAAIKKIEEKIKKHKKLN